MDRRDFLNHSALAGGVLLGGSLLSLDQTAHAASANDERINIPATKVPVVAKADVVVVGGGPGGFAAALRAARHGVSVILIEKFDMPGGMHTVGLQGAASAGAGGIHTELMERFANEGYIHTTNNDTHPYFSGNPLSHYTNSFAPNAPFSRQTFNPEGAGCIMVQMLEEAGVKAMYGSHFSDAVVKNGTITEVIVENASGRQAISGKIFIDGTGTAELTAKAGAPFVRAGGPQPSGAMWDGVNRPIPGGVLWTMAGIDYQQLLAYQMDSGDWALEDKINAAKLADDIPDILFRPRMEGTGIYGNLYIGKPTVDMDPIADDSFLFWQNIPYEWELHLGDDAEHDSQAKAELRKLINAEAKFLKKYVPGFQNSYITNVARYLGVRDSRHPIGEYVFSIDDAINERTFPDSTVTRTANFHWNGIGNKTVQIPYRCFLPQKIDNLLLTGASMSFGYDVIFMVMREFRWCTQSGEIAGYAAGLAIENQVTPKALNWTQEYQFNSSPPSGGITLVGVVPSASVKSLNGNKNDLTITITENYSDGSKNITTEVFSVNNNAAGSYEIGSYTVYVNIKGGDQIRECYIVK